MVGCRLSYSGVNRNKVYVKMIDKLYVIVTSRRKLDGFKCQVIIMLFTLCYGWTPVRWGKVINIEGKNIFYFFIESLTEHIQFINK